MSTQEEKQKYLREEILLSNYDPDQFIQFLKDDLRIEQLNLDLIQFEILQKTVLKFKQYKYYQIQRPKDESRWMSAKKIKVQFDNANNIYDYEFQQKTKCIQVDPFSKNLQVYVPNFQIVQTQGVFSFMSKTQIWYNIKTNINNNTVKRLQYDFQWLASILTKIYPLQAFPDLQLPKNNNQQNQYKRKKIQQYLKILANRHEFRKSILFFQFLTTPYEKLQKMKKNYQSLNFVKGIHGIKNDDGEVNIVLSNKIRNYYLSTSDFLKQIPIIQENIQKSIDKVTSILSSACDQIDKIVDYYAQIHELYSQINNKNPEFKINDFTDLLINTNNLFHVISHNIASNVKIMNENLRQSFKISLSYNKNIYKIHKNIAQYEREYTNAKYYLNKKKQKIYPDVNKWEVNDSSIQNKRLSKEQAFYMMLPKESEQLNQQLRWLAYLYSNYKYKISYVDNNSNNLLHFNCVVLLTFTVLFVVICCCVIKTMCNNQQNILNNKNVQ